ncbi:helix-turn-helix transcriptional regulator [Phenylobacterium aquaticum]|uniref:ArsR/SmtB family transcription factor n=1 Tax=Phenylobacterium aquaticum TaxID=1763816 RepID=UPI0026EDB7EE|nr:metalloregulator ArsR/SmtB family transcription factor [Phenylobacterium aquaticum]
MSYANSAFSALADPTRRQVFERLALGPAAVVDLAQGLPVSRPAVSQHLKILKEAGLVSDRPEGTRRVYQIDPKGLGAMRAWLDQFWAVALDAYAAEVERQENLTQDAP